MFLLGCRRVAFVLVEWLAPWRYRLRREAGEQRLARTLVHVGGGHARAVRAARPTSRTSSPTIVPHFSRIASLAASRSSPAIRSAGRSALRSRAAFVEFAHERDWRVAVLGASEARSAISLARAARAYHGDEAVVDTQSFWLDGRPIRKVRQSVHRLSGRGTVRALRPSEVTLELREELERSPGSGGAPRRNAAS